MQNGEKQEPGQIIEPNSAATPAEKAPATPAKWQLKPDDTPTPSATSHPAPTGRQGETVSWTASEYVAHEKALSWYITLATGGGLAAILIYLLTRDPITAGMIVIITIAFGVFAARKPRVLNYALDQGGIHIASKFYPYADFKSFAVMDEDNISSIWLMPLRRFMPSITMYYAPDDEENIVTVLSDFLPIEDRDHDMVDRLMRKVRF